MEETQTGFLSVPTLMSDHDWDDHVGCQNLMVGRSFEAADRSVIYVDSGFERGQTGGLQMQKYDWETIFLSWLLKVNTVMQYAASKDSNFKVLNYDKIHLEMLIAESFISNLVLLSVPVG